MKASGRSVTAVLALVLLSGATPDDSGLEWIALKAACFTMGSANGYPEESPAVERCMPPIDVLKTEVSNAQFAHFVAETGYTTDAERGRPATPDTPPGSAVFVLPQRIDSATLNWWRFTAGASWRKPLGPAGPDADPQAPVVHVTRRDAQAFARWAGGRLPTEAEWEFAARQTSTAAEELEANTWQGLFPVVDRGLDGYAGIAPVGSYAANAQGLHDMLGNVWELTLTPYAPSHAASAVTIAGERGFDPAQPAAEVVVIKGGSYLCASDYCMRFRPAARQAQDTQLSTSHIGFRLVRD